MKRGSAKGNTLQKRGFLKGIHCEKGICKGIHCKREYTVKGNTGLSKRERRVLHFKTMLSRIVVTGQAKSQAKQYCVSQHRYLDAFHERENKLGRCDSYLRNLKLSLTHSLTDRDAIASKNPETMFLGFCFCLTCWV